MERVARGMHAFVRVSACKLRHWCEQIVNAATIAIQLHSFWAWGGEDAWGEEDISMSPPHWFRCTGPYAARS
eukprot:365400-Chlamydomonas_euryale.AAC.3